jgi:hypothetical protein
MIKFRIYIVGFIVMIQKKERYNWNWLRFKTRTRVKLGFYQPIQRTSLYCIAHVQKYMSSGPHGGLGDDTPHVDHQE